MPVDQWTGLDLALRALAVAAVLTGLVGVPLAMRAARALGVVAEPGERTIHAGRIPLLGGLGMLAGIVAATALALDGLSPQFRAILIGAVLFAALGAIDDAVSLAPLLKLAGQAACTVPALAEGVTIDHVTIPPFSPFSLGPFQYVVTLVFMVAAANIVNLADGMDGLAAGLCAISAATFAILALSLGRAAPAIVAAAVCGACLGFLPWNFHPARVFMGDAGALMLGYLLAATSIVGVMKTAAALALVFPLLVLGVPILDTSFVIAHRIRGGRSVFTADRAHLHHRMLRIGYSQRRAALVLYSWCLILAAFAIAVRFIPPRPHGEWSPPNVTWLLLFAVGTLAATAYVIYALEILKYRHLRRLGFARGAAAGDDVPVVVERRRRRDEVTWP